MTGNPDWAKMTDVEIIQWLRPLGPQCDGLKAFCAKFIRPGMTIAEIGCFAGGSSRIICHAMAGSGVLYCVDPWVDVWSPDNSPADVAVERVFNEFLRSNQDVVAKWKMTSAEAAAMFRAWNFDGVYVDGNHEMIAQDIELWRPLVRPGGFFAGHDYSEHWPMVIAAVDAAFGRPTETFIDFSWAVQL